MMRSLSRNFAELRLGFPLDPFLDNAQNLFHWRLHSTNDGLDVIFALRVEERKLLGLDTERLTRGCYNHGGPHLMRRFDKI
jgi:hypothetical protein